MDQLERFEGILIATTNLEDEFDQAFERRFLFKIKFEKPNSDIKKKIWKNKLDWLNETTAEKLAANYDLSGGEIDNIARKLIMDEVVKGKRPSLDSLDDYCKSEKIHNTTLSDLKKYIL